MAEFADYLQEHIYSLLEFEVTQIASFRSGNDRVFRSTLPSNKQRSCQISMEKVRSVAVYGTVSYSRECSWPAQSRHNAREGGRRENTRYTSYQKHESV